MTKVHAAYQPFIKDGTAYVTETAPRKVTGTAVGGIIGCSPWETPFSIACRLLNLYIEDISDKPAVKAGQVLEAPILDYLRARGYDAIPAEEVFEARKGEHGQWAQDFEDPIFGGHVDGITADGAIIEVKTTSNPEPWLNGIPEHYWLQASLYAHFMGADRIIFAVGVLGRDDTSNPHAWRPDEDNTFVFEVEVHPDIEKNVEYIREWYADYIAQGRTPEPDLSNEKDCAIIRALDAQIDEPDALMDELEAIERNLEEYKALKDRADEIKELMILRLDHMNETTVSSAFRTYTLTESNRTTVDTDALKRDGLYEKYSKSTKTRTLRAKRRK